MLSVCGLNADIEMKWPLRCFHAGIKRLRFRGPHPVIQSSELRQGRTMGQKKRTILCTISLAAALWSSTQSWASGPTTQQIVQALEPSPPPSATTRGIEKPTSPAGTKGSRQVPRKTQTHLDVGGAPPPGATAVKRARVRSGGEHKMPRTQSVNLDIDFSMGSSKLTPAAKAQLDQVGRALSDHSLAGYRFGVIGHTDTVGQRSANLVLSATRARAVAIYLEKNFHISPKHLDDYGVGEKDLLVPTPPQTPNPRNRRVEIVNLGR